MTSTPKIEKEPSPLTPLSLPLYRKIEKKFVDAAIIKSKYLKVLSNNARKVRTQFIENWKELVASLTDSVFDTTDAPATRERRKERIDKARAIVETDLNLFVNALYETELKQNPGKTPDERRTQNEDFKTKLTDDKLKEAFQQILIDETYAHGRELEFYKNKVITLTEEAAFQPHNPFINSAKNHVHQLGRPVLIRQLKEVNRHRE